MVMALMGLVLVVVGLWLAWAPLGLIAAGLALLLTASELGDKAQVEASEPDTEMNWG